jgi:hypothetical protein
VTSHWQDDRWIEPQARFFRRYLPREHRVYAAIGGIDSRWAESFFFAQEMDGIPSDKLDRLAAIVAEQAAPEDLILFCDGDAFPIAPIHADVLGGRPLAAVRRDENLGEQQPHPCFCLTTVGFWNEIGGTWTRGYTWKASNGEEITEVGANLLGILTEGDIEWRPLLRSNRFELDPLWFGIYADVAYHHGAGFRPPVARRLERPEKQAVRDSVDAARVPASVPVLGRLERSVRYRVARRAQQRTSTQRADADRRRADEVFAWIRNGDEFSRRFLEPNGLVPGPAQESAQ